MKKYLFLSLTVFLFISCSCGGGKGGKVNPPPEPPDSSPLPEIKPTINVYVENSGSMAGYMNDGSEFIDAVYDYLTEIHISEITDTLSLFYINDKIEPKGYDIDNFIKKIKPNQFASASSDISNMFEMVLKDTDSNQVSVFITDGIFSPGKGKNATNYLAGQQTGIKKAMANHLKKHPTTAVIVYQLTSDFKGTYYNREDKKTQIKQPEQRPYYIWVIGDVMNISWLKAHIPDTKFKGSGIQHSHTFLPSMDWKMDYAILNSPKLGSFERDKKSPKTSIYNIKTSSNGDFMFTIGMNLYFFSFLLGEEPLMNTDSYARVMNNNADTGFFIEIEENININTEYTHNMKLIADSKNISLGELKIILRSQFPQWIYDINDDEGLDIYKSNAMNKTFGIKYLAEGIDEAYNSLGKATYATMKINLKK